MKIGNKEPESELFKDFNEVCDNKKDIKQEEKTGLNKDFILNNGISKVREPIILIKNSDYERKEKSKLRPKYIPVQKRDTAAQTDFSPFFLKENEEQNSNEPKITSGKSLIENFQINKLNAISQKISQQKYLGKKTKNNSPKNIKKCIENNQCNNKDKLLQEKNKNNYIIKNKENINPIKANINKEIFINNGSSIGNNINIYKTSFVNYSYLNETKSGNNPNFIFNFNDIKKFEEIGLFNSIEKDKLTLLNIHDIQDFQDIYDLLDYHDFYEEQRISQLNLNIYYGY